MAQNGFSYYLVTSFLSIIGNFIYALNYGEVLVNFLGFDINLIPLVFNLAFADHTRVWNAKPIC